jgi:hypothetical protein
VARAADGVRRQPVNFCVRAGLFSDLGAFFCNSESITNRVNLLYGRRRAARQENLTAVP